MNTTEPEPVELIDRRDIISAAELARRYGVKSQAVANWANRYDDFPRHVGRPGLYLLSEIIAWRATKGWSEPE